MRKLYPVSVSCEVLEVSASGYFNWQRQPEDGHGSRSPCRRHSDEALLAHIRAIHAEVKGEYGWPRMHKEIWPVASVWAKTGFANSCSSTASRPRRNASSS